MTLEWWSLFFLCAGVCFWVWTEDFSFLRGKSKLSKIFWEG